MKSNELLAQVEAAVAAKSLTADAAANIKRWLTEPVYAEYAPALAEHIAGGQWKTLDDVFWTVIPFGTGGRRGRMYPIGSNAINDRTIAESAQGLADYVRDQAGGKALSCAIAYDTRHNSRHFAELCAEVLTANGFTVYFLDGYRSTPELSFAVRERGCACGIMVTASHNPPSDNAVKAYWSTGGQLLPPHDRGVIERVMSTREIRRQTFADAVASQQVIFCQEQIDDAYQRQVLAQSVPGPRDVRIIYSPMHGVGAASVLPVLAAAGFKDVELFAPHATPDGDFPNVPGHVSNPENPATFETMIVRAQEADADLVMSTDPDADRLGGAARANKRGPWQVFTGNQIGALLADFVLDARRRQGGLSREHYIVQTLVTTQLTRRIADSYGVKTVGDLLVGFKYIAGAIDEHGPARFVFGAEESHGYQAGQYARDKDATVAALLLAELAAAVKAQGKTLWEKLDALYWQHGCHVETQLSKTLPGSEGMAKMRALMQQLRTAPPRTLAGHRVAWVRDYGTLLQGPPGQVSEPLVGPRGDLVMLDLEQEGNYVAVRPSGTEPKVKFYLFAYEPAEMLADLDDTKRQLTERLEQIGQELVALAERV
ncbi:MAG: phospho-sugar mutase [Planctomycetes bacterium]|nr:phospho-sugar mutase [Planctomycetota bacterium]